MYYHDYDVMNMSEYGIMDDCADFAAPMVYADPEEEKRKKFWRRVAIGSAIAGGTLAGAYALSPGLRQNVNSFVGRAISLFRNQDTPKGGNEGTTLVPVGQDGQPEPK